MKHKRLKNCYCRLDGWLPLSCNLSMITQIDNVIISISGVIDNHNSWQGVHNIITLPHHGYWKISLHCTAQNSLHCEPKWSKWIKDSINGQVHWLYFLIWVNSVEVFVEDKLDVICTTVDSFNIKSRQDVIILHSTAQQGKNKLQNGNAQCSRTDLLTSLW